MIKTYYNLNLDLYYNTIYTNKCGKYSTIHRANNPYTLTINFINPFSHRSRSDTALVNSDLYKEGVNKIREILKTKSSFSPLEKVYVSKWCKIPRDKLDKYFEDNNIKRVWNYNKADYVIINKEELKFLSENKAVKSLYLKLDPNNEDEKTFIENNFYLSKVKKQIFKYHFIITNLDEFSSNITFNLLKKQYNPQELYSFIDVKGINSRIEIFDLIKYIIENPKLKVVFDHEVLDNINSEGLEMNSEVIESLYSMLSKGTESDIKLALEIVSGIDFKNYKFELAILFNKFSHIIKAYGTYNSGCKIVSNYLLSNNLNYKEDWRKFIYNFMKNYPEQENLIKEYFKTEIERMFEDDDGSFLIKIKNIELDFI